MKYLKGFSVTELLVSLAILGALGSVIVYNQNSFNKSVSLQNAAHELSILFREQQSQATNVLDDNTGSSSFNDTDRGIYIDISDINNVQFLRFYDENANGIYNAGSDSLASIQNVQLNSKYLISQICVDLGGGDRRCNTRGAPPAICEDKAQNPEWLPTVVYARPLLQPKLRAMAKSGASGPGKGTCPNGLGFTNDRLSNADIENISLKIQYRNAASASDPSETVIIDASGSVYVQ